MKNLKVGDIVKYSSQWLRSAGIFTGDICFASGRIIALEPLGKTSTLAVIDWQNPNIPDRVLTSNLVLASKLHLERV